MTTAGHNITAGLASTEILTRRILYNPFLILGGNANNNVHDLKGATQSVEILDMTMVTCGDHGGSVCKILLIMSIITV